MLDEKENEYFFKKNASGNCVNLTSDGFCSIQRDYGHDFIPRTCRNYPRLNLDKTFLSMSSLTLSCPEVSRLLFEDYNSKSLFEIKSIDKGNSKLSPIELDSSIAEIIHNFVQNCINSEKYLPSVILLHIGQVLCEMAKLSHTNELDLGSLQKLTSKPNQIMFDLNQYLKKNNQDTDKVAMGRLWKFILYFIPNAYTFLPVDTDKFQKIIARFADVPEDEAGYSMLYDNLSVMRNSYRQTITNDRRKMMKNYLRVKFINNNFPWDPLHGNIIASYLNCIFPYMLVQILLWITNDAKGTIDTSDIVHVVSRVERKLGHNIKIYEYLSDNPDLLHLDKYLIFLKDA